MKTPIIVILIFATGLISGAAVVYLKPWPWHVLREAVRQPDPTVEVDESRRIVSKFIDLDLQEFSSTDDDSQDEAVKKFARGGGLGAYLDDALLVDGHGSIYLLLIDALRIKRLIIQPPPNGRLELYSRDTGDREPKYKKAGWHRYTDIAYHNGFIYLIYSHFDSARECFTTRVARLRVTEPLAEIAADAKDWNVVFTSTPCFGFKFRQWPYAGHQAGGKLAVSADGQALLMTIGDYEFDGVNVRNYPQDVNADYGKILKLDLKTVDRPTIISIGHRNSQGITVTPNGDIWSTEHGPDGGDELNHIVEGGNYGWPYETYGANYGARVWPLADRQGRHDRYRKPSWAWVPSVGTSGVTYVSDFHETWNDNLLVASLVGNSIFRIVTDAAQVITMERIDIGERVRALINHRGFLLVHTDTGDVYRIAAVDPPPSDHLERLTNSLSDAALSELNGCLECHSRGTAEKAPNLCNILGRNIGDTDFAHYSDALKRRRESWNSDLLASFLHDAQSVIPGMSMPNPRIGDPQIRMEIIESLSFFCSDNVSP